MLYEYYLFNHAAIVSLQGQTLIFHATDDIHAKVLGLGYAKALGWGRYSIVKYNGEKEITL